MMVKQLIIAKKFEQISIINKNVKIKQSVANIFSAKKNLFENDRGKLVVSCLFLKADYLD